MTATAQQTTETTPAPINEWSITANLRLEEDGPIIDRESVTRSDLIHVNAEFWFNGYMRKGHQQIALEKVQADLQPIYMSELKKESSNPNVIAGYNLIANLPDGQTYKHQFTRSSVPYAAERAGQRSLKSGRLPENATYFYEIEMRRGELEQPKPSGVIGGIKVKKKDAALNWLIVPLKELLDGAKAVGEHDARWCQVFYTKAAHEAAERFSRKGAAQSPAVETGCALIGTLCVCPESGDMFVVVTDVVEVMHSQATEFSLEYTSDSWDRITTIIESMQSQPERRTWRLIGQAHGHNFLPANGAEPCEACQMAQVCSRRTDYVSSDDITWTRAVFAKQPFALSHIFGLTARHKRPNPDEVDTLFGMADGRLLSRAFHVIDEFDPSQWEQGSQDNQGDHHGR